MKSLLVCVLLFLFVRLSVCQNPPSSPTACHNCNEWVGIGTGLGVSFLVIGILLVITVVTLLVVRLRKREGYEEFS